MASSSATGSKPNMLIKVLAKIMIMRVVKIDNAKLTPIASLVTCAASNIFFEPTALATRAVVPVITAISKA